MVNVAVAHGIITYIIILMRNLSFLYGILENRASNAIIAHRAYNITQEPVVEELPSKVIYES